MNYVILERRKRRKPMAAYVNKRSGIYPRLELIGVSGAMLFLWGYVGYLILQLPIPL
jgi:hypothetical protein